MVIDFVAFGVRLISVSLEPVTFNTWNLQIIKNHVNSDGSGSHAFYSVGMWTCLAAMVLLFFGTIIVFITCCTHSRRTSKTTYRHSTSSRHSRY
jgi:hypothetical protein